MSLSWPEQLLDILLPHRCQQCGMLVGQAHALCPDCWPKMHFIVPPYCAGCGLPFPHDYGSDDTLCARCLAESPPFSAARSAAVYDDESKALILRFKHGDQLYLAPAFASWMHRAAPEWFTPGSMIIPVPLHRTRIFMRRYNQAALLARALAKLSGQICALDGLVRHRRTPSQGAMNREQRLKNVTGAFRVHSRWQEKIKDRDVILVDDVLTTGATASVCAKTLMRAGARDVKVLTLMRVA
ncbi:MAG TPA: hypothetical protein DIS76_02000 [Rhodospirillaceae bacterium]|nr:hypothetical protein [Rhodospirillaceae bacterium]